MRTGQPRKDGWLSKSRDAPVTEYLFFEAGHQFAVGRVRRHGARIVGVQDEISRRFARKILRSADLRIPVSAKVRQILRSETRPDDIVGACVRLEPPPRVVARV